MMTVTMIGTRPRGVSDARVKRVVIEAFRAAKRTPRGSVSVAFVSEKDIAKLNGKFLHHHRPTDVLSFAPIATSYERRAASAGHDWGDILIASSVARREANRRSIPLDEEILRLIAHGTLHLLGFDHATERDETKMFGLQERAVARVQEPV